MAGDYASPTIAQDDLVLASKIAYRTESPQTGDLIVFRESYPKGRNLITRVIGKSGDTIEIKDNQVLINGKPENGDYQTVQTSPLEDLKKITLSPNQLFVLADNRDAPHDSRHLGPISVFSVVGKINYTCWPLGKLGSLE